MSSILGCGGKSRRRDGRACGWKVSRIDRTSRESLRAKWDEWSERCFRAPEPFTAEEIAWLAREEGWDDLLWGENGNWRWDSGGCFDSTWRHVSVRSKGLLVRLLWLRSKGAVFVSDSLGEDEDGEETWVILNVAAW